MNTEMPKKSKFDILEEIMINFQNDYETDNAQTHWVKTYKERKERLIQLQEEENMNCKRMSLMTHTIWALLRA